MESYETKSFDSVLCAHHLFIVMGISGRNSSSDDTHALTALSTFGDDVKACTPSIAAEDESAAEEILPEDGMIIANWSGWNPSVEHTVFQKLFQTDCVEGIFDPIDKADMFIAIINLLQQYWQTSGTYPDLSFSIPGIDGEINVTAQDYFI